MIKKSAISSPDWFKSSAVYQVNLRTFSKEGTIISLTEKLKEIKDFGFSVLYLCPIYSEDATIERKYWSRRQKASMTDNPKNPYRIKDYFSVDDEYGTLDDLKNLVLSAHKLDMRVILDLVYTHIGPDAYCIREYPEYAVRDENGNIILSEYNFVTLNFSCKKLREYLYSNIMFYVREFNVDGFRCDYCDSIPEDFFIEALSKIHSVKPDGILIEEGSVKERLSTCFNAMYCFSWHENLYKLLNEKIGADELREKDQLFKVGLPENGIILRDLENHDTVSDWEKRCENVKGVNAVDVIIVLNYLIDGIPMVYSGNEIADSANLNLFANRFFRGKYETTDRINNKSPESLNRQKLIKKLNLLRKENIVLKDGTFDWIDNSEGKTVLSFVRNHGDKMIFFAGNFSDKKVCVSFDCYNFGGENLLQYNFDFKGDGSVEFGPYGYVALSE